MGKPTRFRRASLRAEALEDRLLLNAGDLDVVFGSAGKATTDLGQGAAQVQAATLQSDDKIVAVGEASISATSFSVARYNRNGSLDAGFGTAGMVTTSFGIPSVVARDVAMETDGRIVGAGFGGSSQGRQIVLARYNADGSLDAGFGSGGLVMSNFGAGATANSLVITSDNKIIVAGSLQESNGSAAADFLLARFDAGGILDTSFGSAGHVITRFGNTDASANKLLLQPDGKIIAAGHTSTSSGNFNFALARYNADGSLDTTFGGTGTVTTHFDLFDDPQGAVLQADGKIVAAGSTTTSSKTVLALARYNPDGSLDATFGNHGQVTTDLGGNNQAIHGALLQPDGKLLAAGTYAPAGPSEFFVARYQADGALDLSFGTNGFVLTAWGGGVSAEAARLALLSDGTFIAAGHAGNDFALGRYWGDNGPPEFARGSPDAVYIAQVYQGVLGRQVDPFGLSSWLGAIQNGATRQDVVRGIENSSEYRAGVVDGLFTSLLGRHADPYGLGSFVAACGSGATIEQVKAGILGSPEYFQRSGGSNAGFLQALYHDALNRKIDPAGSATWGAALANGAGRDTVSGQVLTSGEAERDLVQGDYQQYLHRPAEDNGLAFWIGRLQQGQRDEDILAGVVGSGEFFLLL